MLVRNGLPKEMGVQSDTKSVRVQDASQLVLIREGAWSSRVVSLFISSTSNEHEK